MPSTELRNAAQRVGAAVVLISVFDEPGKLLRTVTGFFVSADGKIVTSRQRVQDAAHAVVKTADGRIYNVSGTVAEAGPLDVTVLQAEVKKEVPFLTSGKAKGANPGTAVALVASPLARGPQPFTSAVAGVPKSDQTGEWLELSPPPPNDFIGAPAINDKGELLGVVIPREGGINIVRNAAAIDLLVAKIGADTTPRWAGAEGAASPAGGEEEPDEPEEFFSPTPSPAPRPTAAVVRAGKPQIIYNPKPQYPAYSYFREKGSGTFRVTFSANGQTRRVDILQSTGSQTLDNITLEALRKWKSTPGQEWNVTVPVTFQRR